LQSLGALVSDLHSLCSINSFLKLQFLQGKKLLLHGFGAKTTHKAITEGIIKVMRNWAM